LNIASSSAFIINIQARWAMNSADKGDLVLYAEHQAEMIRSGTREDLDLPWLAEQLAEIRHHQQEIIRYALADLCTCIALRRAKPQAEVFCRMRATEASMRLSAALEGSPSLHDFAREFLSTAWGIALGRVEEMHPAAEVFPDKLGYSIQALLNHLHHEEMEITSEVIPLGGRTISENAESQEAERKPDKAQPPEKELPMKPNEPEPVEQELEAHPS
jgi:hypothetical protein